MPHADRILVITLKSQPPPAPIVLNEIRGNNLNNVIIGLNVNHVAGKYNDFKLIIPGNIDIMILVETKLDNSYPTSQFLIDSYSTHFRRDRNKSEVFLFEREDIPCKLLNLHRFPDDIECLFLEVNLRKTKILLFATSLPRQHDKYYFQCIGNALGVYSPKYEKYVLVEDLNAEENEAITKQFLELYGLKSLVHASTCFKSLNNPSCIDLILTNCYRSFQNMSILSSGLSDCHKMVITVMKTRYPKAKPRHILYRNYKIFDKVTFNDHLLWYLQATPAAHINFCKF